ncbi:MAG: M16 family metallopeptidase [Planctomycetota bacterium]|jgi:predicted Zn-dependent peptidase
MKSRKIFFVLTISLSIISISRPLLASKPVARSFTLPNGIRIVSLYIAESKNVSIFSFLPMGVSNDGPGQAQWSHLVEHLVIRTTIPLRSQQGNAETMPDHMRLDFYGTVDKWQEGLSHHARWLKGVPFTKKNLQVEKTHVNSECDITAKRLATHKFAMAAWAQGYRHGQKHAALKGNITKVTLNEIQKYRDMHLAVLNRMLVCVVGGIDAQTLKPVITEKLGMLKSDAKTHEPIKLHRGNRKMTWDLDASHLVLTWPIPDFSHNDYPALMVASRWLMMKCFSDPELKKMTGMVWAGADLTAPEGNFFCISASIKPEASFDDVREKIERHLQPLRSASAGPFELSMIGQQLSYQMSHLMDPAITKAQTAANLSDAMIEGNIGLQWSIHDFRYGRRRKLLARKLAAVTPSQVHQVASKYLTADKCSACTLIPDMKVTQ